MGRLKPETPMPHERAYKPRHGDVPLGPVLENLALRRAAVRAQPSVKNQP